MADDWQRSGYPDRLLAELQGQTEAEDPSEYGQAVGSEYDLLYPGDEAETEATVAMLDSLAGMASPGGSLLELGIGTGRIALPLLEGGLTVAGIEASEEMISQLRAKPRGEELEVLQGDYARDSAGRLFSVVLLSLNGIFSPPTREEQIECFENAARHLEPGGCFVVEAYVLRPDQLGGEWSVWPRFVRREHVELQVSRHDAATNRVERTMIHLRRSGLHFISVTDSYATPGELDLIARAAGLRLRSRFGSWCGDPFDGSSGKHVSLYELDSSRFASL